MLTCKHSVLEKRGLSWLLQIPLFNNDTPGMVGRVGDILGTAKVNIDEMVIGHGDDDGVAMMIIKTNTVPSDELLKQLSAIVGVSKVASTEI